jgi:uncharacterized membrane protein YphA (DoxX/SURF4 family)
MYGDASWLDTAGRLIIVFFFLAAGLYNVAPARARDHIERMAALGVPLPAAAFWFGMMLQFTGCALVLAGWHADVGVWCLIVFTVVANAMFHRFWRVTDPGRRHTLRLLLLNGIAIVGGLLLLLGNVR